MKFYRCIHVEKQVEFVSSEGPLGGYEEQIDSPCGVEATSLESLLSKLGDKYGLNIDEIIVNKQRRGAIEFHRLENNQFIEPSWDEIQSHESGNLDLWQAYWQFTVRVIDQRYLADADFAQLAADDPDLVVIE